MTASAMLRRNHRGLPSRPRLEEPQYRAPTRYAGRERLLIQHQRTSCKTAIFQVPNQCKKSRNPLKSNTFNTSLQSVPFSHSGTPPQELPNKGSNPLASAASHQLRALRREGPTRCSPNKIAPLSPAGTSRAYMMKGPIPCQPRSGRLRDASLAGRRPRWSWTHARSPTPIPPATSGSAGA